MRPAGERYFDDKKEGLTGDSYGRKVVGAFYQGRLFWEWAIYGEKPPPTPKKKKKKKNHPPQKKNPPQRGSLDGVAQPAIPQEGSSLLRRNSCKNRGPGDDLEEEKGQSLRRRGKRWPQETGGRGYRQSRAEGWQKFGMRCPKRFLPLERGSLAKAILFIHGEGGSPPLMGDPKSSEWRVA